MMNFDEQIEFFDALLLLLLLSLLLIAFNWNELFMIEKIFLIIEMNFLN